MRAKQSTVTATQLCKHFGTVLGCIEKKKHPTIVTYRGVDAFALIPMKKWQQMSEEEKFYSPSNLAAIQEAIDASHRGEGIPCTVEELRERVARVQQLSKA